MSEKNKYLSYAIGAAMSVTLAAAPAFSATSNLFEVKPLKNGYLVAQADTKTDDVKKEKEAKCSKKMKDGKCGKDKDGHCSKKEMKDGKCSKEMKSEGKSGEQKCGKGSCGSKKKTEKKDE